MMLKYSLCFLFLLVQCVVVAQVSPFITWQRCYGGDENDYGFAIATSDGGSLVIGSVESNNGDISGNHGIPDCWLAKLDPAGNIQWQRCYGGSGLEYGMNAIELIDGYIVLALAGSGDGDLFFNFPSKRFWVFKIDFSGNIIWQQTYGGFGPDSPKQIVQTSDGGFIISGSESSGNSGDIMGHHGTSGSDLWIFKIDSIGNLLWQKCLGGTNTEIYGNAVIDFQDNIYVSGITTSSDGNVTCYNQISKKNGWIIKLNNSGDILWDKCFGGTGVESLYSLNFSNNKLLLTGYTSSDDYDLPGNFGNYDIWVMMLDTAGNIIFSKNYGGSSPDYGYTAVFNDFDSRIYVGGETWSDDYQVSFNHGYNDTWLLCLDTTGNLLWQSTFGGSFFDRDISTIIPLGNSKLCIGGSVSSPDGDIVGLHGDTVVNIRFDIWLAEINLPTSVNESLLSNNTLKIFPNPSTGTFQIKMEIPETKITLSVFNPLGETIFQ